MKSRERESERAVSGTEMRAQHVAWCVTMATAVCIPKITTHTHTVTLLQKKKRQSVAVPDSMAVQLIKMEKCLFFPKALTSLKRICLSYKPQATSDVLGFYKTNKKERMLLHRFQCFLSRAFCSTRCSLCLETNWEVGSLWACPLCGALIEGLWLTDARLNLPSRRQSFTRPLCIFAAPNNTEW